MDQPPTVRRARPEEADFVIAMQRDLFPGDVNGLSPRDFVVADVVVLVAVVRDAVVGFAALRQRGVRPWTGVDFLGVVPSARRRGIGAALVGALRDASDRPLLRLFVRPSNRTAADLYRRHGFRVTGRRRANYEDGEDALVMMAWAGLGTGRAVC